MRSTNGTPVEYHLTAPDLMAITAFILFMILLSRLLRSTSSFRNFAIGDSEIPGAMVFAGLAGAYIGPGYTIGFTAAGFSQGYLLLFLGLCFSLQTILVGVWVVPQLSRFGDCLTAGDIIGHAYGKKAQIFTGIISVLICTGFLAVLGKVAGQVISRTTSVPESVGVAIVTVVGVIICFNGGLKSVIATEAIQFCIYAAIIPAIVLIVATHVAPDWHAVDQMGWTTTEAALSRTSWLSIVSVCMGFFLGETLIPPGVIRALSAPAAHIARWSFVLAGIFSAVWFGASTALGVIGRAKLPQSSPDTIFFALAFTEAPHFVIALAVVALLAIIMSCQEGVINAGSVSFARDTIEQVRGKVSNADKANIAATRLTIICMGTVAYCFALLFPTSVIESLLLVYSLWAASVLPPLLFAVLLKKTRRTAGLPAMIAGMMALVTWGILLPRLGVKVIEVNTIGTVERHTLGIPALLVGLGTCVMVFTLVSISSRSEQQP